MNNTSFAAVRGFETGYHSFGEILLHRDAPDGNRECQFSIVNEPHGGAHGHGWSAAFLFTTHVNESDRADILHLVVWMNIDGLCVEVIIGDGQSDIFVSK